MDYRIKPQAMKCASTEAESLRYEKHEDISGNIWLVAKQPNAGDNVYVYCRTNQEGFSGRTLAFELDTGEKLFLKGPWHTNSDALFVATGVDVRDKHLTFGCVAFERIGIETMRDIIYIDSAPTIGPFDRIKRMAQKIANEIDETVQYYVESQGGSSMGPMKPEHKHLGNKRFRVDFVKDGVSGHNTIGASSAEDASRLIRVMKPDVAVIRVVQV